MDISELLTGEESEWLDFKKSFHSSNVRLLHDLLCLANAYVDHDRYLVLGIADDGAVTGIEVDPHRKTNANLQDLIRGAHFNRIPTIHLEFYEGIEGHTVAVLHIRDRPDKPFFLIKDRIEGQERIRAGVVYTRLGDTNIPLTESAPEDHIELMWRERFGLGMDPLARVDRLLADKGNWVQMGSEAYLYHREFPEFTIRDGQELVKGFQQPWTKKFPDETAWSYYVEVRYHTTILKRLVFVACDGGRYRVPVPDYDEATGGWIINLDGLGYKISELYGQYYPLPEALSSRGIRFVRTEGNDDV